MVHQERKQQKTASSSSSPKASTVKDMPAVPDLPSGSGSRSILDFGKAKPGEETAAPSIALHIPLNARPTSTSTSCDLPRSATAGMPSTPG